MSLEKEERPIPFITIVSGLPRSGTSLVMQMLSAGGMPILCDNTRPPDIHNPRGYFEYAPVKSLQHDTQWLPQAFGKAVKIISWLLPEVPDTYPCRILFVQRDLQAILASQRKMLAIRPEEHVLPGESDNELAIAYEKHLQNVQNRLARRPNCRTLYLSYPAILQAPHAATQQIVSFLSIKLDQEAMSRVVDPALCHNHTAR